MNEEERRKGLIYIKALMARDFWSFLLVSRHSKKVQLWMNRAYSLCVKHWTVFALKRLTPKQ